MIMHPIGLTSGGIEVICGPMFSGKTEELLRRLKRAQIARQKVEVFKPVIDDRYSKSHVQSHDASRIPCFPVKTAADILKNLADNTRVVGIDESQFFGEEVVEVANKIAYRGIRVVIAGLDQDYRGEPFGPIPALMAIAESVLKLSAVCTVCGSPATRTQRLSGSSDPKDETVLVGGQELYEPRCRFHHEAEPEPVNLSFKSLSFPAEADA